MKHETPKNRRTQNPDARDTKIVRIEMPIDLYNFFHDCYLPMQTKTFDQVIARAMSDLAGTILNGGLSSACFDADALARKYNLTSLLDSTPEPETPSESVPKPSGGD